MSVSLLFQKLVAFVYPNAPILNTTYRKSSCVLVCVFFLPICCCRVTRLAVEMDSIFMSVYSDMFGVQREKLSQCVYFRIGYNRSLTTLTNTLFYRFSLCVFFPCYCCYCWLLPLLILCRSLFETDENTRLLDEAHWNDKKKVPPKLYHYSYRLLFLFHCNINKAQVHSSAINNVLIIWFRVFFQHTLLGCTSFFYSTLPLILSSLFILISVFIGILYSVFFSANGKNNFVSNCHDFLTEDVINLCKCLRWKWPNKWTEPTTKIVSYFGLVTFVTRRCIYIFLMLQSNCVAGFLKELKHDQLSSDFFVCESVSIECWWNQSNGLYH